ncbi:MAG: thiol:disulfide interchange protein DsbA/DsbL [Magnetococcales bacterium]|nr:thiol:disulfide interchange protein DsbA/DsbL [Magnetococcales bacterium]
MIILKLAKFLRNLLLIFLLITLITPLGSISHAMSLEENIHYEVIVPPVPQPGIKPTIVEVFNFKCPHCLTLHYSMEKWSAINNSKYNITSLPIYWGKQTDMPIRAYFAAKFLGKGDLMKDAIFKAHFENSVNIESSDELGFLSEEIGLDPEKFKAYLGSFGVSAKIAQANEQQRGFVVHSTPTLVVNGKYRVSFGKHADGNAKKLFKIVETLAAR